MCVIDNTVVVYEKQKWNILSTTLKTREFLYYEPFYMKSNKKYKRLIFVSLYLRKCLTLNVSYQQYYIHIYLTEMLMYVSFRSTSIGFWWKKNTKKKYENYITQNFAFIFTVFRCEKREKFYIKRSFTTKVQLYSSITITLKKKKVFSSF